MIAGLIAPGDIDTRSIEDVHPDDLRGYRQCHFFAGVGIWSYAARQAGWPDDRPFWSASCPCQPFSEAGQGNGFADERHLWPAVFHLATHLRPQRIVGEQVARKDGHAWLDLVSSDLESADYAFRAVPLCSGGFGGPDRRHRNYWVADAHRGQRDRLPEHDGHERHGAPGRRVQGNGELAGHSHAGGLGHTHEAEHQGVAHRGGAVSGSEWPTAERAGGQFAAGPGPLNGFWADADWLLCRDERWRPVEPGTFPLDTGIAARLWRLRAFGDAINAQVAREFLEAIDYVDAAT